MPLGKDIGKGSLKFCLTENGREAGRLKVLGLLLMETCGQRGFSREGKKNIWKRLWVLETHKGSNPKHLG